MRQNAALYGIVRQNVALCGIVRQNAALCGIVRQNAALCGNGLTAWQERWENNIYRSSIDFLQVEF